MASESDRPAVAGWTPPAELDDYELVKQLGSGQHGQVYLALDTLLDRHVAVRAR